MCGNDTKKTVARFNPLKLLTKYFSDSMNFVFFAYHLRPLDRRLSLIFLFLFKYGRVNIETANKKRGIIDHTEDEEEERQEEVPEALDVLLKPETPPLPKKNGLVKKLSQNGIPNVISKESLLLVPGEGGETFQLVNGHSQEKTDQKVVTENITNNNTKTSSHLVISVFCNPKHTILSVVVADKVRTLPSVNFTVLFNFLLGELR